MIRLLSHIVRYSGATGGQHACMHVQGDGPGYGAWGGGGAPRDARAMKPKGARVVPSVLPPRNVESSVGASMQSLGSIAPRSSAAGRGRGGGPRAAQQQAPAGAAPQQQPGTDAPEQPAPAADPAQQAAHAAEEAAVAVTHSGVQPGGEALGAEAAQPELQQSVQEGAAPALAVATAEPESEHADTGAPESSAAAAAQEAAAQPALAQPSLTVDTTRQGSLHSEAGSGSATSSSNAARQFAQQQHNQVRTGPLSFEEHESCIKQSLLRSPSFFPCPGDRSCRRALSLAANHSLPEGVGRIAETACAACTAGSAAAGLPTPGQEQLWPQPALAAPAQQPAGVCAARMGSLSAGRLAAAQASAANVPGAFCAAAGLSGDSGQHRHPCSKAVFSQLPTWTPPALLQYCTCCFAAMLLSETKLLPV